MHISLVQPFLGGQDLYRKFHLYVPQTRHFKQGSMLGEFSSHFPNISVRMSESQADVVTVPSFSKAMRTGMLVVLGALHTRKSVRSHISGLVTRKQQFVCLPS